MQVVLHLLIYLAQEEVITSALVFVAEYSGPPGLTVASPRNPTSAMLTSRIPDTLVASRSLPTHPASECRTHKHNDQDMRA